MLNFDDMKMAVEALSGGKNTVCFDDVGMPSIMVILPKMLANGLIAGGSAATHPAFILDGAEQEKVAVSKYQNIVVNNRAYSLPMQDPKAYINFDQSLAACRLKGSGWGLMPYSLWSAIALWCRKNGTMPHGNNNYGRDVTYIHERGVCTYKDGANVGRTATGSGPDSWNHDNSPLGIADLNGNVWEWCAGMRLQNAELQIIPNADCMKSGISMAADSSDWKAIKSDGSIVDPGTTGTLKWDWVSNQIQLTADAASTTDAGRDGDYKSMTLKSGLTAPEIAKLLLFYPDEPSGDYGGDHHWFNGAGERLPLCGGYWGDGAVSGVFAVNLDFPRSYSGARVGFRSAFYGNL